MVLSSLNCSIRIKVLWFSKTQIPVPLPIPLKVSEIWVQLPSKEMNQVKEVGAMATMPICAAPGIHFHVGDAINSPYKSMNLKARLVYADPPYNTGFNEGASNDRLTPLEYQTFTLNWMQDCITMMDENSRLVVCTYWKNRRLIEQLMLHNFESILELEQDLIWTYNFGIYTRKRFVPSHDVILVYRKGKPKFYWEENAIPSSRQKKGDKRADPRGRNLSTILHHPRVPGNSDTRYFMKGLKRTSQPVELLLTLVQAYTAPGEIVYDLFSGSGSMAVACGMSRRQYFGLDICNQYVEEAINRVIRSPWVHILGKKQGLKAVPEYKLPETNDGVV